jgi:hypothetical protein
MGQELDKGKWIGRPGCACGKTQQWVARIGDKQGVDRIWAVVMAEEEMERRFWRSDEDLNFF